MAPHPSATKPLTHISAALLAALACSAPAIAHDIYTGIRSKQGQLCCGGTDCARTIFREHGSHYEFQTRDKDWVTIPEDRITFLPIPGDAPSEDETDVSHRAHLCYASLPDTTVDSLYDRSSTFKTENGNFIRLFCAFIPPSGF